MLRRETRDVPGVILSSFSSSTYNSGHINSVFDTDVRFGSEQHRREYTKSIAVTAEMALRTALDAIFNVGDGKPTPTELLDKFVIDQKYIGILMDCFFNISATWNCPLFKKILNKDEGWWSHNGAYELYIEVKKSKRSLISRIVKALMVKSLGEVRQAENARTADLCDHLNVNQNVFTYVWQVDPNSNKFYCYETTVYDSVAKSPAFEIPDYNFSSGKYSTWVESVWESNQLEIYLRADYRLELYAGLLAIVVLMASTALYHTIREEWFFDYQSVGELAPQLI